MKKVSNPFENIEGHNCFGCSPVNPYGLNLRFETEGDKLYCKWVPGKNYVGYKNILHGGIQSTIMDEIASWSVFVLLETAGVTSRMEIDYKRPCVIDEHPISLTAQIVEKNGKTAKILVKLFDSKGKLCTEGYVFYYTFDREKAKVKLGYPGIEKFLSDH